MRRVQLLGGRRHAVHVGDEPRVPILAGLPLDHRGRFQPFPFEVFLGIWLAAHIAALIWLRAGWFLIVPGLNDDVLRGNISTFVALFAVLAIQRSAAWWAPVLLTKITPAVGIVWHIVRREWRSLDSSSR